MRDLPDARFLSPAASSDLSSMTDQLLRSAANFLPGASRPNIVGFAVSDRLKGGAEMIHDPANPANAMIVIGGNALELYKPEEKRAMIAHEIAEHMMLVNDPLVNDPRFTPRSPELRAELDKLQFHMSDAERASVRKSDPAPWWPFGESMTDRADHMIGPLRKDSYLRESRSDKLAVWLTRDPDAMIKVLALGTMLNGEKFQPDAAALHASEISARPHPSFDAREAEIKLTAQDIQQVRQPMPSMRP